MSEDPFFIGWEASPERQTSSWRISLWGSLVLCVMLGLLLAGLQTNPGKGIFAFGEIHRYRGLLISDPVPFLVSKESGGHVYLLVNPLKYGFSVDLAREHHLQQVSLQGSLIDDGRNGMIEVFPGSISNELGSGEVPRPALSSAGTHLQLRGEIVDSKCHLGVMNPGRFKPHRACAIQCIAGGIPPMLVVQTSNGALRHYLLVGPKGETINQTLLEFVAEPVSIRGTYRTIAGLHLLYADPNSIERL